MATILVWGQIVKKIAANLALLRLGVRLVGPGGSMDCRRLYTDEGMRALILSRAGAPISLP
jgi:hypothetical protein